MYITCKCNNTILALYQRWKFILEPVKTYEIDQFYYFNFCLWRYRFNGLQ